LHPCTRALVAAVTVPRVQQNRAALPIRGSLGEAPADTLGCQFRSRCPHACERCMIETPALREANPGCRVACHLGETA
jgi:oligopeptide/dipeptide ABC transporter ATP-binding protein